MKISLEITQPAIRCSKVTTDKICKMCKMCKCVTITMCKICSKLTIKTPERRQWRVFIVKLASSLRNTST